MNHQAVRYPLLADFLVITNNNRVFELHSLLAMASSICVPMPPDDAAYWP
ncbi:hypothetical protein [Sodalis-like endosymbiont of Proechinophthirus fluctus]|nr:hypothetical protein [Sodalis-like endosymbiont of Proechinophthirus fluctus]